MEVYQINALVSGLLYAVGAAFSKQALGRGAGVLRISFIVNIGTALVFLGMSLSQKVSIPWSQIHYPVIAGCCFFVAQIFTFAAIRFGDVSLQTPLMGSKSVFAVFIAVFAGTEEVSGALIWASIIMMVSVALLGFSGTAKERVGLSICLALMSSLVFAISDTMVGAYAGDFGVSGFLFILMTVNALLSLSLVPFFRDPIKSMPKNVWPFLLVGTGLLAFQALLLNDTFGRYQQVAEINILFSTRGLWSVVLTAGLTYIATHGKQKFEKGIFCMRLIGALMICGAIAILL